MNENTLKSFTNKVSLISKKKKKGWPEGRSRENGENACKPQRVTGTANFREDFLLKVQKVHGSERGRFLNTQKGVDQAPERGKKVTAAFQMRRQRKRACIKFRP